jgi:hypothetical protein
MTSLELQLTENGMFLDFNLLRFLDLTYFILLGFFLWVLGGWDERKHTNTITVLLIACTDRQELCRQHGNLLRGEVPSYLPSFIPSSRCTLLLAHYTSENEEHLTNPLFSPSNSNPNFHSTCLKSICSASQEAELQFCQEIVEVEFVVVLLECRSWRYTFGVPPIACCWSRGTVWRNCFCFLEGAGAIRGFLLSPPTRQSRLQRHVETPKGLTAYYYPAWGLKVVHQRQEPSAPSSSSNWNDPIQTSKPITSLVVEGKHGHANLRIV